MRMASSVALSEAQSRLGELMDRAESGEEIVIERAGRAGMRLVPLAVVATNAARRVGGQNLPGVTYIAPDFDAPMSEQEIQKWGY